MKIVYLSIDLFCSQTKDGDEVEPEAKVNVPEARSVNLIFFFPLENYITFKM